MEPHLLDSNIIIYAIQPDNQALRNYVATFELYASKISKIEVLGYHALSETDRADLELFFANIYLLGVDDYVINTATDLRKVRNLSLGDSLIAATAITNQMPLFTAM